MTTYAEPDTRPLTDLDYPTSDGRPMGETDLHRSIMMDAIESLQQYYAGQQVYVSGNILLFYEPGNRRRHISPDVLVVKGLEQRDRKNFLLWQEGRPPDVVIEVTSESTRTEDVEDKFEIYRDRVQVAEYFLFDPYGEYLKPALQGYRLHGDRYEPIEPIDGRLPSGELGLHLEAHRNRLRFFEPAAGRWIPTLQETRDAAEAQRREAEAQWQQAEAQRREAEAQRQQAEEKWRQSEAEVARLRRELEAVRRQLGP